MGLVHFNDQLFAPGRLPDQLPGQQGVDGRQAEKADGEEEQQAGPVVPGFRGKLGVPVFRQHHNAGDADAVADDGQGNGAEEEHAFFPKLQVGQVGPGGGQHEQGHQGAHAAAPP